MIEWSFDLKGWTKWIDDDFLMDKRDDGEPIGISLWDRFRHDGLMRSQGRKVNPKERKCGRIDG